MVFIIVRRLILVLVLASVGVIADSSIAHGASKDFSLEESRIAAACDPNGLPGAVAMCNGKGRLSIRLRGTVVLTVQSGRITLKGKALRRV